MEWRKCVNSFPYFFKTYWKAIDVKRGVVDSVEPRPEQLESAKDFQDEPRLAVLKARQIGWSTLVSAYLFWASFFHENWPTMALSRREDPEAYLIIAAIKTGHSHLPEWMRRRGPKQISDNKTEVAWSNGSYVESDSSKDDPARGRTLKVLVLDEFGKMPNPVSAWSSAGPATEHGQLIVIGNANGYGSEWWRICQEAKSGRSNFKYSFYPWWVVPGRTKEWLERETSTWLPHQIAAEYPNDDQECWVQSGNPVFDGERLKIYPVSEEHLHYAEDAEIQATTIAWEEPIPGMSYVAGVDVSLGKGTGDYSVVNVICVESGKHVLEWRARQSAIWDTAKAVDEIGRKYNNAWVGVEINGVGEGVINRLREFHAYPNLYSRRVWNRVIQGHTVKYGWDTSATTKATIISELQSRLFSGEIVTTHQPLILEMMAYRYLDNGQMGGVPNDDRVMSMAITARLWFEHAKSVHIPMNDPAPEPGTFGHHIIEQMGQSFYENYYDEASDRFTLNGGVSNAVYA